LRDPGSTADEELVDDVDLLEAYLEAVDPDRGQKLVMKLDRNNNINTKSLDSTFRGFKSRRIFS